MGVLSRLCGAGRLSYTSLLILFGWNLLHIESIQVLSVTGASRRIGFQRQSPTRHIHINPFSSIAPNRISYISSNGKPHIPPVSHVRRDVSLVNVARETDNSSDEMESGARRTYNNSGLIDSYYIEDDQGYLDDDSDDNFGEEQPNEPICRVVATSDAKIPLLPAYSSLSHSSKTLVRQLELLYAAQSKKKLRNLTYFSSQDDNPIGTKSKDEILISTLKQSLEDGGFKLLDQRDFDLCSALNAGYLLRLSLLPDLKDLDPTLGREFYPELFDDSYEKSLYRSEKSYKNKLLFDGRVLVFRRGYSQEITTGRLLLPKLDYLQASLVQRSSASLTRKFGVLEQKLEDLAAEVVNNVYLILQRWWLQGLMVMQRTLLDILNSSGLLENQLVAKFVSGSAFLTADFSSMVGQCGELVRVSKDNEDAVNSDFRVRGNKIFRLGRYGVGERYSTFTVIANSLDLSDVLSPFSICEVSNNDTDSVEQDMYEGLDAGNLKCQYDEMYGPSQSIQNQSAAVRLLERVSLQNTVNFFTKYGRRDLIKNYFKKSILKEPSYEEVVVVWRPKKRTKLLTKHISKISALPSWLSSTFKIFDVDQKLLKTLQEKNDEESDGAPVPLEIRSFNDVPMANLLAVLPKTKLVFRPADALVFDLVSIVSFFALGASLKFDNPRLDLLAFVSLSVFAVRTFFRYSNKYARYDLLVNKFLTKKLAHRDSGALNYIVSQADSQRALRSGLIRDWLDENKIYMSTDQNGDLTLDHDVIELGKSFTNEKASTNDARIDVNILSAIDELSKLGILDVVEDGQSFRFQVKDDQSTSENIRQLWTCVLPM